jgi:hypothetical protein
MSVVCKCRIFMDTGRSEPANCLQGGFHTYEGAFRNSDIHKIDVWRCCNCYPCNDKCSPCVTRKLQLNPTPSESNYLTHSSSENDPCHEGVLYLTSALQHALKKALEHDGVARGLRESVKALDRRQVLEIQFNTILRGSFDSMDYIFPGTPVHLSWRLRLGRVCPLGRGPSPAAFHPPHQGPDMFEVLKLSCLCYSCYSIPDSL